MRFPGDAHDITSYHIISYQSCHIMSYHIISCQLMSGDVRWCLNKHLNLDIPSHLRQGRLSIVCENRVHFSGVVRYAVTWSHKDMRTVDAAISKLRDGFVFLLAPTWRLGPVWLWCNRPFRNMWPSSWPGGPADTEKPQMIQWCVYWDAPPPSNSHHQDH